MHNNTCKQYTRETEMKILPHWLDWWMQRPKWLKPQRLSLLQIYSILNSGIKYVDAQCAIKPNKRLICANIVMVTFAEDKLPAILEARGYDQRLATTLQHRQLGNHVIYGTGHARTFPGIWVAQMLMPIFVLIAKNKNVKFQIKISQTRCGKNIQMMVSCCAILQWSIALFQCIKIALEVFEHFHLNGMHALAKLWIKAEANT